MASVYDKNGTWYLRYKDAAGVWRAKASTAKTKTEAKRLAADLERLTERQRLGLEPILTDSTMTLGELCKWWLENACPASSEYNEHSRLTRHVIETPLGQLPLKLVTAGAISARLREMERADLSASYAKGVRTVLHTVYGRARKAGVWIGPNPVDEVEAPKIPRRVYVTLRAEEVPLVLENTPNAWRDLFATAVYTGMRKGELFGLLKTDVDLEHESITVSRSYDKATTKGRHADTIPIADGLLPYLTHAINHSPSRLVFPAPDGSMRSPRLNPEITLRRVLARAGLVDGWDHICRRCKRRGDPHVERHPDSALRLCPKCKMKLWPRALPRNMRFHDLRHTSGTLMLRAGVDAHRVQLILRHRDIRTTTGTYGHLLVDDLREAVNRPIPVAPEASQPLVTSPAPLVTPLLPEARDSVPASRSEAQEPKQFSPVTMERETGFEPATFSLEG